MTSTDGERVRIGECEPDVERWRSGPPLVLFPNEDRVLFTGSFLAALGRSHTVHVPHHPGFVSTPAGSFGTAGETRISITEGGAHVFR